VKLKTFLRLLWRIPFSVDHSSTYTRQWIMQRIAKDMKIGIEERDKR